ncbi:MAG: adenosine deaminase, partial [Bacteroidota bacterium]
FIAPAKCHDLADYLTHATNHIKLMQTETALRLVTLDLLDQLQADYVIYSEIRFAPLEHTRNGLSPEKVVEVVNRALAEGSEKTGVKAGLILCTLRHYSEAKSIETVKLVKAFQGSHVVGFDIAADEAGFPIDEHKKAFDFANKNELNITAHAGEAKGAESVWETIENFHPKRIGHGVRSIEDPKLVEFLRKNSIHLEVCPTSNIQTDVVNQMSDHPVNQIYKADISIGINTDARAISNTTLTQEYQKLNQSFNWQLEHFKSCNLQALKHAFVDEQTKQELREIIMTTYV